MSTKRKILIWALVLILAIIFAAVWIAEGDEAELAMAEVTGTDPTLAKPDSEMIPTVQIAKPIGWAAGEAPHAGEGLTVTRFAEALDHPRVLHTLPNGDVLVTLTRAPKSEDDEGGFTEWVAGLLMSRAGATGESPDELVLLRDADGNGTAEQRFVLTDDLESPSGIAWADDTLYVANHDALLAFSYALGATQITAEPRKLMDLPAGGNHWMRNLALDREGTHIYVAVGSASNIAEKGIEAEEGRAAIWEYDIENDSQRIFATGLRNPNGLAWNP